MPEPKWILAKTAAKYLGVDSGTIRRWCVAGKVNCQKVDDSVWIVDENDLLEKYGAGK